MKNIGTFIFTSVAAVLLFNTTAYAYLDPGVGTVLLQVLAAIAIFIGIGWRFIVRFFKKIFGKKKKRGNRKQD